MTGREIVVVGGGTAGCTVVSQLASMTSETIILIESGRRSTMDDESRFMNVLDETNAPIFAMVSLVEGGVTVPYPQAHALGGGSAINAMLLSGEVPPSVEGLTRFVQDHELGSISRALVSEGGSLSRMWWNAGRWNPGRAVHHLAEGGRITILEDEAVLLSGHDGFVREIHTESLTLYPKHVVMCAGALATPALFLSSGMKKFNSEIGVGLQDHPTIAFTMKRKDSDCGVFDVSVFRRGTASTGQEFMILGYERVSRDNSNHALVTVSLMNPTSRGAVSINGGDIGISMNMLATKDDIVAMRDAVRSLLEVVSSPSFSNVVEEVVIDSNGRFAATLREMQDSELDSWIRQNLTFVSHAASSCHRAVDGNGNLFGSTNLTVADASVLAQVPSHTPAASVTMEATRIGRVLGKRFA